MPNPFHFSRRTDWELSSNQITSIVDQLKKENQEILNLTESNPTACGFQYSGNILRALADKESLSYEPDAQGMLKAREAITDYYRTKNVHISPEQIFLTASTSEAYSYLFRLLADPEDCILFPTPSYPLFQFLGDLNDVQLDFYPLQYFNEWVIDFKELEEVLNPRTKGIVLVNPNNPTGSFIKPYELEALNALCHEQGLSIICDEVFHDFSFEEKKDHLSLVNNKPVLTFVLGGLSKTLALPQMKLSWIILSGPSELVKIAQARLEVISDTYLSVNTPVQHACASWLKDRHEIQNQILERIRHNLEFLKNQVIPVGCQLLHAEGGWYAVVRIPNTQTEEEWIMQFLKQDGVFVHPGYFFDFSDDTHIVLSLLPQEKVFQEGLSRVLKRIQNMS
ncbi:MAG: pyridoxal phosphate-dependent aminotransferase [Candidatus Omnitrophica bacterium]|nr:pyridoxal phosphate-dependent aminotransferase [Candidatus Omnitrophota bacterium]